MTTTSTQNLLDQVDSLLPLIQKQAAQAEQLGHLTDDVLERLFDLRLFRLFIAKAYDGESIDLPNALRIFEKIASADGATGWLVMIGAGGGLFSGFIEAAAAAEIFTPKHAVIAGSGSPFGLAETRIENQTQKYQVSGRWPYASGAYHASWFTANCQVDGDKAHILSIAVPKDKIEIHDTWSVMGMKATGSHDFSVTPTLIDANYTFDLFATPLIDEPIFHCPLMPLAHLTFASVALGIAKNALYQFEQFHREKTSFEQPDIQQTYQIAFNAIHQSSNQLYQTADSSWRALQTKHTLSDALIEQIATICIEGVHNCVTAVDELKNQVGMLVVFNDSEFGRAWRDIHVLSQHALLKKPLTA